LLSHLTTERTTTHLSQEPEHVAPLLTQARHDRQYPPDEPAAFLTLRPERLPSPQHRTPQGALCFVVRRFDPFDAHERSQASLYF
jgi:hypothetical protein